MDSAYTFQFFGLIESPMNKLIWKAWAPPKVKNHVWLALRNRLSMADRLHKRGWYNCGLCPLCRQTKETNNHLFVYCRFTVRVWELLKDWLGLHGIHPRKWSGMCIQDWWYYLVEGANPHRKGLASLVMLTVWEIWKERNARVFRHKLSPSFVIYDNIKCEARFWVLVGAKRLGELMPGE
jgi:hypothetical protein